jgi:hypothetical protein
MKKEVCLMCIVCFFLGYFVADVVSKCGFGREHLAVGSNPGGILYGGSHVLDNQNDYAGDGDIQDDNEY